MITTGSRTINKRITANYPVKVRSAPRVTSTPTQNEAIGDELRNFEPYSSGEDDSLNCTTALPIFVGCGSPVVKVSNHGRHVMSSIPVPLKTRRVGQRCTLNLSRAETFSPGVPAQVSSPLDHF
ncbi:hypothetical protein TNCV_2142081 [Trichonephila clavipes]|uniref:Uncharacterized protein n=1 Tax=Trichonephila clavipes TaxID=2585209 RepID=A0A8X6S2G8_TRICX|nr:hypothetical protein TNCV_2142081 [Trichonephila clavipes]